MIPDIIDNKPLPLQRGVTVAIAVAAACWVGLWFLDFNARMVAMIWPAAGVAAGFCFRWGAGAIPWIMLGHVMIWFKLGLGPVTGWTPPVYAAEAFLAVFIGGRLNPFRRTGHAVMERTLWRLLVAPLLACIPCGLLMGWIGILHGRYPAEGGWTTAATIGMAHFHGMIAMGPLTVHLLGKETSRTTSGRRRLGWGAALVSLAVVAMTFRGLFRETFGMSSAVYLAFPLVVLAATMLTPRAVSFFIALWCLLTTALTGAGSGPFDIGSTDATPFELGLYNTVFAVVAYTVSVGSSRYLLQYRRNRQSLEAAGVEPWEWTSAEGVRWLRPGSEGPQFAAPREAAAALAKLSGTAPDELAGMPDRWKVRHAGPPPESKLLVCSGRILSRHRDGSPAEAIGLLEDLSLIRKAEDALIAVGYQRAKLKSLQSRLNPHFLFNSLNATRALIHIDPALASESVTRLSRLLRANLRNIERPLIPLAEEIGAVNDLLAVASMRFGERLKSRLEIEPQAGDHPVPPMLVFNLVENALIHGIEKSENGGELHVEAKLTGDECLHVRVRNPGTLPESPPQGIGIGDVRQRLEILFGSAAMFSLVQSDDRTVTASVLIPTLP
jgi:hypothetical protein